MTSMANTMSEGFKINGPGWQSNDCDCVDGCLWMLCAMENLSEVSKTYSLEAGAIISCWHEQSLLQI